MSSPPDPSSTVPEREPSASAPAVLERDLAEALEGALWAHTSIPGTVARQLVSDPEVQRVIRIEAAARASEERERDLRSRLLAAESASIDKAKLAELFRDVLVSFIAVLDDFERAIRDG